jgi:hypothetical protein
MNNTLAQAQHQMVKNGRTNHLSNVLMKAQVGLKRKAFDPAAPADRMQYAHFMEHGVWKDGKSFHCELPFNTVPVTVQAKLLRHFLKPELSKVAMLQKDNIVDLRKAA